MKEYRTHNDRHFPDHITKISDNWINIYWAVTWKCNLRCSYCFKKDGSSQDIIDTNTDKVIKALDSIRQKTGKNIFFSFTGGEPTILNKFPEFMDGITKIGMQADIASNLTLRSCKRIFDYSNPENTMVQASYHTCELSRNSKYSESFIDNFKYGLKRGLYCIFKIIVRKEDIPDLENRMNDFRNLVGMDFPFYLKVLSGNGYPMAYTEEERKKLFGLMTHEREYQKVLVAGADKFYKMKCEAGRGLIVLNNDGSAYRCTGTMFSKPIGHLLSGIKFSDELMPCESEACGCTPQAVKYGKNPWDYVNGIRKEDASYCKYGCPQEKLD